MRVLGALYERMELGQPPPSYRDLCSEFGWRSTGTARDHLQALERKGYVALPRRRGGRVQLHSGPKAVAGAPVMGRIVAGVPASAAEHRDGVLPFPVEWSAGGRCFALTVTGDSMVDAGILDGDQVIVRQQETANSGEIVATTIDGETTLKRFVEDGNNRFLVADNPRYEPIKIVSESALIHGVVVGLLRGYQTRGIPRVRNPVTTRSYQEESNARRA